MTDVTNSITIADLNSITTVAENEKGKALQKIHDLRIQISKIETEIRYCEGKRDLADSIIQRIEDVIKENVG